MKRINKYIRYAGLAVLSVLFLFGCNNFEDINTNPDDTTSVSASLLATNVILRYTKFAGRDGKSLIADNALPKYVGYANEGQLDQQYNKIGSGYFDAMTILPNIQKMIEYAQGQCHGRFLSRCGCVCQGIHLLHAHCENGRYTLQ